MLNIPENMFGAVATETEVYCFARCKKLVPHRLELRVIKIISNGIAQHDEIKLFFGNSLQLFGVAFFRPALNWDSCRIRSSC